MTFTESIYSNTIIIAIDFQLSNGYEARQLPIETDALRLFTKETGERVQIMETGKANKQLSALLFSKRDNNLKSLKLSNMV